jgi:hypothetical protein
MYMRVERCTYLFSQGENSTREEKNIGMSNVMRTPPEYHAPPYSNYAPVPGSSQQPRKSYRWVRITPGILALVCVIGGVLLPCTWMRDNLGGLIRLSLQVKTMTLATQYQREELTEWD